MSGSDELRRGSGERLHRSDAVAASGRQTDLRTPYSGLDYNSGKSPTQAVKTLKQALALATAGKNDTVHFIGGGNASAYCTDYQSALLDWNKDLVHLVGESAERACRRAAVSAGWPERRRQPASSK